MLLAVSDGPAFFDAEVVDGENVRAAEAEDEKHFNGPGADAADGDEALDELFVGESLGLCEGGDDAVDGFLREVLHGEDFGAGEAGFAKDGFAELEHLFWRWRAAVAAEGLDAAENGGGCFAGDGLVGDGFEEGFVGRLQGVGVHLEWQGVCDQLGELLVFSGEVVHCGGEIEGEMRSLSGHGRESR